MKSNYFSTRNILTALFILSIIYTTLQLFSLQDDLILSSSSLNSSDIATISPVLNGVYFSVTFMILSGLLTLIVVFRTQENKNGNGLIMENGELVDKSKKDEGGEKEETKATLDLSFIQSKLSNIKDEAQKYQTTLTELCKKLDIGQGAIYLAKESKGKRILEFHIGYAFSIAESETVAFEFGEGLVGQAAKEGLTLRIDDVPDNYINIVSGLGQASPNHLLIIPLIKNSKTYGVVELASFATFDQDSIDLITQSFNLLIEEKSDGKTSQRNRKNEIKVEDKKEGEKNGNKEADTKEVAKKGKDKK